jgi:hypothetical protein
MESGSPKHDARSPKPQRVHLPTGRVVELKARGDLRPRRRAPGGLIFSELTDLVASGDVAVVEQSEAVDPGKQQLRDFHALRAISARLVTRRETDRRVCRGGGDVLGWSDPSRLERIMKMRGLPIVFSAGCAWRKCSRSHEYLRATARAERERSIAQRRDRLHSTTRWAPPRLVAASLGGVLVRHGATPSWLETALAQHGS